MFDHARVLPSRPSRLGMLCALAILSAGLSGAQTVSDPQLFGQISRQCAFFAQSINAPCVNQYRDKLEYLFFQGSITVPDKMEIGRQLLYAYGSSPADMAAMRSVAHRLSEYHDGTYPGLTASGDAGSGAPAGSSHAWQQFAEVDGECDIHGSVTNSPCVLAHRAMLEDLFYNSDLDVPDKIAVGRKLVLSYSASPDDMRALKLLSERMRAYQTEAADNAYSRSPDMSSVAYGDASASGTRRPPTLYTTGQPAPNASRTASRKTAQSNPPAANPNPAPTAPALTAAAAIQTPTTASASNPSATNPVRNAPATTTAASTPPPTTTVSASAPPATRSSAVSSPPPASYPSPVRAVAVSSPPPPAHALVSSPAPTATRGVTPIVAPVAHILASGPSYALIIGIDQYPQFPKLRTAVSDAKAVEAELRLKYGFRTELLLDAQADRAHIMTALSSFRRTLSPDSNLLIYYAGHGLHDRESDKVYWLPVDAEPDNSANWLQTDDVTSEIRAIPARHVLIVADSCYAGGMTRDAEALFTPTERSRFLEKVAAAKSRDLLSSGGDEPVADAGGAGGHSVFAAALIRGLDQIELDRFTAAELFSNYIRVIVAGNSDQTPEYNFIRNSGHDAGDFTFVRQTR